MAEQTLKLTMAQLRAGVKLDTGSTYVIEVADGDQRICVADYTGQPLADMPYFLEISGSEPVQGVTDGDGWTETFDASSATSGRLVVGDQIYQLTFVDLVGSAPADVQSLLNGTGWEAGPLDGDIGQQTRSALVAFQRSSTLDCTGEADDATVAALRARMGLPGDAA